jgi:signal transduction histidine kinase
MTVEARRILVVDDDAEVRSILAAGLAQEGYEVVQAGDLASARAALDPPVDLALLDLNLPDGDGIDLAVELKAATGDDVFFPVILITGLDDTDARVRGFRAGCDDFLSKPINLLELRARIHTLLTRRAQHAQLAVANHKLRQAQERKQVLASLVVHDLRNPLSALQGNVELLMEDIQGSEFADEILGDCKALVQKCLSMVAGLLDVEELEEGLLVAHPVDVDVASMCLHATRHHGAALKLRSLSLEFQIADDLRARLDADLVGRLVENLLDNAVRYAPRKGRVVVTAERDGGDLVIVVGNDGPPVPDSEVPRIFGRYYRLEARRSGARANRGLGLYFCKLVAEAHRGTIEVTERPGLPACFEVRIPQDAWASAARPRSP